MNSWQEISYKMYAKKETKHWALVTLRSVAHIHTNTQTVFMPTYCRSGCAWAQGKKTDARVTDSQLAMGLIDVHPLQESKQKHDNVFILFIYFHLYIFFALVCFQGYKGSIWKCLNIVSSMTWIFKLFLHF